MTGIKTVGIRSVVLGASQSRNDWRSLTAEAQKFDRVNDNLPGGIDRTGRSIDGLSRSQQRLNRATPITTRAVIGLFAAFQAFRGLSAVGRFFRETADDVTSINNQLRQATNNAMDLLRARQEIEQISLNSRTSFVDNVSSFTRISIALPNEDLDTRLRFLENFNRLGAIGGATGEELNRSLVQIGQSFAGGIVRAEEFNSVVENTPAVVRQIAASLGIGVGALRQRVIDGQLTAQDVLGGLTSEKTTAFVDMQFATLAPTIDGALLTLRSQFSDTFGEFLDGTGVATGFANLALDIAGNLNSIGENARENGLAVGAFFRGITTNFRNQSFGDFVGGIFEGNASRIDASAIDLSGNAAESSIQQRLNEISANTKSIDEKTAGRGTDGGSPINNPGFFVNPNRVSTRDPRIDNAVDGFINNLIQDVVDVFTDPNSVADIDPFGGGRRGNVTDRNQSPTLEDLGFSELEIQSMRATTALRFLADEGFGVTDPTFVQGRLQTRPLSQPNVGGGNLGDQSLLNNAINFINYAIEQGANIPSSGFGSGRNRDGTPTDPIQQVDELLILNPSGIRALLAQFRADVPQQQPPAPVGIRVKTPEELAAEAEAARAAIEAQRIAQRVFESQQATFEGLQDFLNEPFTDALREARNATINSTTSALNSFGQNTPQGFINGLDELSGDNGALTSFADKLENGEGPITNFVEGIANAVPGLGLLLAAINLFGSIRTTATGQNVSIGADGQISGETSRTTTATGLAGLIRFITTGSRNRTTTRDFTPAELAATRDAFEPAINQVQEIGAAIGQIFRPVAVSGENAVEAAMNYTRATFAQVRGLEQYAETGEENVDTLNRLIDGAKDANAELLNLGLGEFARSLNGIARASKLATEGLQLIFDNRSVEERIAIERENLRRLTGRTSTDENPLTLDELGAEVDANDAEANILRNNLRTQQRIARVNQSVIDTILAPGSRFFRSQADDFIDARDDANAEVARIELELAPLEDAIDNAGQAAIIAARLAELREERDGEEETTRRLTQQRINDSEFATSAQAELARSLNNDLAQQRHGELLSAFGSLTQAVLDGNISNNELLEEGNVLASLNVPPEQIPA